MTIIARDDDGLSRLPISIEDGAKVSAFTVGWSVKWMIAAEASGGSARMPAFIDVSWPRTQSGLLTTLCADLRDRWANPIAMRANDDRQARDDLKHRGRQMRHEGLIANFK